MRTFRLLVLGLVCVACGDGDADGDGYPAGVDCDDADAGVHPDAVETCDGVDQDCDGVADEDAVDAVDWYADADLDGFGTGDSLGHACEPATDLESDVPGDCDDSDPGVHPGAHDDPCDGVDQDCDGVVEGEVWADGRGWHDLMEALDELADGTPVGLCAGEHDLGGRRTDLTLYSLAPVDLVVVDATRGVELDGTVDLRDLTLKGSAEHPLDIDADDFTLISATIRSPQRLFILGVADAHLTNARFESAGAWSIRGSGEVRGDGVAFVGMTQLKLDGVGGLFLDDVAFDGVGTLHIGDLRETPRAAFGGMTVTGGLGMQVAATEKAAFTDITAESGSMKVTVFSPNISFDGHESDGGLTINTAAVKKFAGNGLGRGSGATRLNLNGTDITLGDSELTTLTTRSEGVVSLLDVSVEQLTHWSSRELILDRVQLGLEDAPNRVSLNGTPKVVMTDTTIWGIVDIEALEASLTRVKGAKGYLSIEDATRVDITGLDWDVGIQTANPAVVLRAHEVSVRDSTIAGATDGLAIADTLIGGVVENCTITADYHTALSFFGKGAIEVRDVSASTLDGSALVLGGPLSELGGSYAVHGGSFTGTESTFVTLVTEAVFDGVTLVGGEPDCELYSWLGDGQHCNATGSPATGVCTFEDGCAF